MKLFLLLRAIVGGLLALCLCASPLGVLSRAVGEADEVGGALARYEAELSALKGGARVGKAGDVGYVHGLENDGDGVVISVVAPETGFYDIHVNLKSVDGSYKENYVAVDGERMGVISCTGREYADAAVERVYMQAGAHDVEITKFWGWVLIDYAYLTPSRALPDDLFDVKPTLVNPNASVNARRLMTYLCDIYGKQILSGQYCDEGMYGIENAAIWRATGGEFPAVLGLDLIELSPSRVERGSSSKAVEYAVEYWDAGGIITMCWHWNAPSKYLTGTWYSGFYTEHTNIDLAKIMSGGDAEGYDLLLSDIDAIALQLKRLADADVPILWRPLHEASGGWFWWGAKGAEAYKALYILMYERLTHEHGLNNLIWVWNGQAPDWYPGDEYVDIIGEDIYPGERVYTSQVKRFLEAVRYTDARKLIVLSENSCLIDPELALRDGAMWGFYATWSGDFVLRTKGINKYSERYTELDMLKKVYASELVVNRSELPDIKNYPLSEYDE